VIDNYFSTQALQKKEKREEKKGGVTYGSSEGRGGKKGVEYSRYSFEPLVGLWRQEKKRRRGKKEDTLPTTLTMPASAFRGKREKGRKKGGEKKKINAVRNPENLSLKGREKKEGGGGVQRTISRSIKNIDCRIQKKKKGKSSREYPTTLIPYSIARRSPSRRKKKKKKSL